MQHSTASENDEGGLCILCAYDRFINATRVLSEGKISKDARILILVISSVCSRICSRVF